MTVEEMKNRKKALGLTYEMIADRAGVSVPTIKKIFSGETEAPRYDTLAALEKALSENVWRVAESSAIDYYAHNGSYTVKDYEALPEDLRVELIDGFIYNMATPTQIHQTIAEGIADQLKSHIRKHKGKCRASAMPMGVQLSDDKTVVVPDVYLVCDSSKLGPKRIVGAPDLVVEIVSPSTKQNDFTIKLKKYQEAGVKEYWIVDYENQTVIVYYFILDDNHVRFFTFNDKIAVGVLPEEAVVDFTVIKEDVDNLLEIFEMNEK